MKNVSKLFFAFVMLSATLLTSCDKEVETSPLTIDLTKTATLNGYVYADLDLTNFGLETVKAGVKVILTVSYSDLNLSGSQNWIDTVATNDLGQFVTKIPTNAKGVTVTISPVDFVENQKQPLGSSYNEVSKVFKKTGTAQTVILKTADVKIQLIEYNTTTGFSDFDNYVNISGKAYAETDLNNSVTENAPLVDVTFSCTGWSKKITLVKTGAYSTFAIDVPNGQNISYTFDFTTDKNISDNQGGWKKELYRYKGTNVLISYPSVTEGVVLSFGGGTKVE